MEDQHITNADVVAGNGDSVGGAGSRLNGGAGWCRSYSNVNLFPYNTWFIADMVNSQSPVSGLVDSVTGPVKTMTEGVVVT